MSTFNHFLYIFFITYANFLISYLLGNVDNATKLTTSVEIIEFTLDII